VLLFEVPVVRGAVVKGTEMKLEPVSEVEVEDWSTVAVTDSLDEAEVEPEDEEVVVATGTAQTLIHSLSSHTSGADPVSDAAQADSSAEVAGNSFPHQHSRENSIPKYVYPAQF
jgi:hypothetical protein